MIRLLGWFSGVDPDRIRAVTRSIVPEHRRTRAARRGMTYEVIAGLVISIAIGLEFLP